MSIEKQYVTTNDWLRYAEAKNGAVVALSSVLLAALSPWKTDGINPVVQGYLFMAFAGIAVALLIALVSFVPFVDRSAFLAKSPGSDMVSDHAPNWSFFGDVASRNLEEFSAALTLRGEKLSEVTTKELVDQVYINSRICSFKFKLFRACVFCLIAALFTPVVALLVWAITKEGRDAR